MESKAGELVKAVKVLMRYASDSDDDRPRGQQRRAQNRRRRNRERAADTDGEESGTDTVVRRSAKAKGGRNAASNPKQSDRDQSQKQGRRQRRPNVRNTINDMLKLPARILSMQLGVGHPAPLRLLVATGRECTDERLHTMYPYGLPTPLVHCYKVSISAHDHYQHPTYVVPPSCACQTMLTPVLLHPYHLISISALAYEVWSAAGNKEYKIVISRPISHDVVKSLETARLSCQLTATDAWDSNISIYTDRRKVNAGTTVAADTPDAGVYSSCSLQYLISEVQVSIQTASNKRREDRLARRRQANQEAVTSDSEVDG